MLPNLSQTKRFEEYAYVLDFKPGSRSVTFKGKDGTIVTSLGEDRLTLLEMLGTDDSKFDVGERVYIGKEGRKKISMVLGRIDYDQLSTSAITEIPNIVTNIVKNCEARFVEYMNTARPLNPRIHALELIPGIGKIYMKTMLEEREIKKFESYKDLQERVGLYDPVKHIAERIIDELMGKSRINIFVHK